MKLLPLFLAVLVSLCLWGAFLWAIWPACPYETGTDAEIELCQGGEVTLTPEEGA